MEGNGCYQGNHPVHFLSFLNQSQNNGAQGKSESSGSSILYKLEFLYKQFSI